MRVPIDWLAALLFACAGVAASAGAPAAPSTAQSAAQSTGQSAAPQAAPPGLPASAPVDLPRGAAAPHKGPQDPMEFLRERLAAKLGGSAALDATHPGVIRIVNRGTPSRCNRRQGD